MRSSVFVHYRSLYYLDFLNAGKPPGADDGTQDLQQQQQQQQPRKGAEASSSANDNMADMFQLTQNYRTHNGIVRLAHSVVRALQFFFPASIDKLKPESSKVSGEGACS